MNVLQGENQGSLALVMCDMTVAWRKDMCVCVCVCVCVFWVDMKGGQHNEKSILKTGAL